MKRRLKKSLIGVIALSVALTGLEGCASPAHDKKKAAKMLQEKYQEEFEIIDYKSAGFFEDYYSVRAYAVEYPELVIKADVDTKTGGMSDTYVVRRLCERISSKISENLRELSCNYYVFTEEILGYSMSTDPNISLENFMKENYGSEFVISLCLDKKDADIANIVSASVNMLNGISGMKGTVCIYLTETDVLTEIQEYVTTHDKVYGEFQDITEDAYIGHVDFENSGFVLTESALREMAGDRL